MISDHSKDKIGFLKYISKVKIPYLGKYFSKNRPWKYNNPV
jgi:hypothetical protein